jgi:hypothetical protein
MKDYLLETLYALRLIYWAIGARSDQKEMIERNIKQHLGETL